MDDNTKIPLKEFLRLYENNIGITKVRPLEKNYLSKLLHERVKKFRFII